MKVLIKSCIKDLYWYSDEIGTIVDINFSDGANYCISDSGITRYITISDGIIINENFEMI